eukprot:GHVT01006228.1.p1 GENE.GHVT01006228.1~~GHVT01006228.1.p1  ORF type:complete len:107 (-),score=4.63 GHVT01006228.1:229-549(-)
MVYGQQPNGTFICLAAALYKMMLALLLFSCFFLGRGNVVLSNDISNSPFRFNPSGASVAQVARSPPNPGVDAPTTLSTVPREWRSVEGSAENLDVNIPRLTFLTPS